MWGHRRSTNLCFAYMHRTLTGNFQLKQCCRVSWSLMTDLYMYLYKCFHRAQRSACIQGLTTESNTTRTSDLFMSCFLAWCHKLMRSPLNCSCLLMLQTMWVSLDEAGPCITIDEQGSITTFQSILQHIPGFSDTLWYCHGFGIQTFFARFDVGFFLGSQINCVTRKDESKVWQRRS